MYHSFMIHSFTDRHLGCFQHLAIVNNAAKNTGGIHLFELMFRISSVKYPEVELLGHMVVLFCLLVCFVELGSAYR